MLGPDTTFQTAGIYGDNIVSEGDHFLFLFFVQGVVPDPAGFILRRPMVLNFFRSWNSRGLISADACRQSIICKVESSYSLASCCMFLHYILH